jgi:ABC-type branched-subunit amino acid transport system substrate-binding protein
VHVPRAAGGRHRTPPGRPGTRRGARRRLRTASIPLLSLAVLLAACLPEDPSSARQPDLRPVQVDTSLGVVRIPAGSMIDVRMVLDGPEDDEGLAAVLEAAFRTAVEDFGVVQQGFRVDLGTVITTTCSRDDGERVGAELATSESVVAVLGPQCGATLLGLQGPLSAAGMATVTSRPTELTFTVGADGLPGQDRAEGVFRTSPSVLQQARAGAEHAAEGLGLVRAATLRDGSLESAGLVDAFRDRFQALGGTVVVDREVDAAILGSDEDRAAAALDALLDAVAGGNIDVAFLALDTETLLAVADGWSGRSSLARTTRLAVVTAGLADFLGDEASQGHLLSSPVLDIDDAVSAVTGMSTSQTRERVGSLAGVRDPSGWWAYAYDAATLLLKALEDTSLVDVDGSLVVSRAELRENLARTSFTGFSGAISCAPLGDCAAPRTDIHAHDDASVTDLSSVPIAARIEDAAR